MPPAPPLVRVVVDLPEWVADALLRWRIPAEYAGSDLADRVAYAAEVAADGVQARDYQDRRCALYRKLGVAFPDEEDDDIDL